MPPLLPTATAISLAFFDVLSRRHDEALDLDAAVANNTTDSTSTASIATGGIQVVCAFPVSGQYGAGSRVL